jgi:hypothetical protein
LKLGRTKAMIDQALAESRGAAALYLSGGSDSLLLLHILMEMQAEFSIVSMDHTFSREQRRHLDSLILEHSLRVFTYAPSNAYLIGDGKDKVSLVEEYATPSGALMPFVRDVKHDPSVCALSDVQLGPWHEGPAPLGFRLNIFGTRRWDRHYATGRAWDKPERDVDGLIHFAPLWDWTRRDVKAALRAYEVSTPKVDTGTLPMCTNCLTSTDEYAYCPKERALIPAIKWDPLAMQREFQIKHGFRQTCHSDTSPTARTQQ